MTRTKLLHKVGTNLCTKLHKAAHTPQCPFRGTVCSVHFVQCADRRGVAATPASAQRWTASKHRFSKFVVPEQKRSVLAVLSKQGGRSILGNRDPKLDRFDPTRGTKSQF
jgi:hypothetical protein